MKSNTRPHRDSTRQQQFGEHIAQLRIARGPFTGTKGSEASYETFDVPFEPGASILDGLIWIREHADPTLAFRYSCVNANVCKECVMRINGKVGYACTERLEPVEISLEPLPNKRVLRDLACDTVPPKERL